MVVVLQMQPEKLEKDTLLEKKAVALVHKYDNEFPSRYFEEFLEFTGLHEKEFWDIADSWRNKNLWTMKAMIGLKNFL